MFYLAIMQNDTTAALYVYQTLSDALVTYHTELAYRGEGRNKTVCSILNAFGEVIRNDSWERASIPEETPDEEPEQSE